MKKIGIIALMVALMTMLAGCATTTYTLQFNDINKAVVANKKTGVEVELKSEQITTLTSQIGKVTFEDEDEDLGDEYLYKVTMNSSSKDPMEFYIYDATHIKMDGKCYKASENEIDMVFYQSLFK